MSKYDLTMREARAEAPAPSVNLAVLRQQSLAIMSALGPKKGEKFLRAWAEIVAKEEGLSDLLPIRPSELFHARRDAQRGAGAWFRENLGAFVAQVRR